MIERNRFADINGDPVKIRDASNHNRASENWFYQDGEDRVLLGGVLRSRAFYCTKPTPECPSVGNEFRYNQLYDGFYGEIATFKLSGLDNACGPLPEPRLRTSGNVQH